MLNLMKKVFTATEVKHIEKDGKKFHRFLATDESEDRAGDIIRFAGWDTKNFENNPVFMWAHDSGMPPIGRGTLVKDKDSGSIFVDVEFASKEFPFADVVERLVEAGFLKAVSVGFLPKKGGMKERFDDEDNFIGIEFTGQELLEISAVPIPMHPGALNSLNDDQKALAQTKGLFSSKASGDEDFFILCDTVKKSLALIRRDFKDNSQSSGKMAEAVMTACQQLSHKIDEFGSTIKDFGEIMNKIKKAIEDSPEGDGDPSGTQPKEGIPGCYSEEDIKAIDDLEKALDEVGSCFVGANGE
jgi:phage head maturation protease